MGHRTYGEESGPVIENVLECAGFGLLVGFAYAVWPPAALLVAGLVCLLVANVRAARKTGRPRLADRLASALAAYRRAGAP